MKRSIVLIICTLLSLSVFSQATFIIDSLPDYTPSGDQIYMAGDFNGWNPGDPAYILEKNLDDKWFITTDSVPEGTSIEFKFTRGDWSTVEKGIIGEEIPNRQFTFGNGDTIPVIIYNWADQQGGGSTAAENVIVMDEEFYMPAFNRNRRIWLYLPPGYEESDEEYPVLYMHDGQNLFDTYTSYLGEWEVDETLNDLADQGYQVPIVVGIDNGGSLRIDEYTPWVNPTYGGGDGKTYIDFITNTLKPYIDENYRTHSGREFTGIMGSSLGGLISFYGAMKYQDVFGKAGVYSPSYWFSDSVWTFTTEMGKQNSMRIYQMIGSEEGGNAVEDMIIMYDTLLDIGFSEDELFIKIVQGGQHNEALWRDDFEEAYLWLFQSYANYIPDYKAVNSLELSPNPVSNLLHIENYKITKQDTLEIYDIRGSLVIIDDIFNGQPVDVMNLKPGLYSVRLKTADSIYTGKFIKK